MGPIRDRQHRIADGKPLIDHRPTIGEGETEKWLTNMVGYHQFSIAEVAAATGLSSETIAKKVKSLGPVTGREADVLTVLPYPGGRHPRIGFLDGAIRPQRETKVSVFAPWDDGGYAVVDVPEAIWVNNDRGRELLYLAHTHVPTIWDKQRVALEPLEWEEEADGVLTVERLLPNQVAFGARVVPRQGGVEMELWLRNGSKEMLSGLRVQNCVMLKGLDGFAALENENKRFEDPFVACRNASGDRWIVTAWERCQRAWGNVRCPCMHSDPQFPDCEPGESVKLRGWISFYEGTDIDAEFDRLRDELGFLED